MVSNDQFVNFIVKNIVSHVEYDADSGNLCIEKKDITYALLEKIEREGIKYGFSPSIVHSLIADVSNNISSCPRIESETAYLDLEKIKIGSHFKVNIKNDVYGLLYVELLCIDVLTFLVIRTDICGLQYCDILKAHNKVWNLSYSADFVCYRKNKPYPNRTTWIRLGILQSVDYIYPSAIYEILESQNEFVKEELETLQKDTLVCYVWGPCQRDPVVFSLNDADRNKESLAVFCIALPYSTASTASVTFNANMKLPSEPYIHHSLMEGIGKCCELKSFPHKDVLDNVRGFKICKPGELVKVMSGNIEMWHLVKKIVIEAVV